MNIPDTVTIEYIDAAVHPALFESDDRMAGYENCGTYIAKLLLDTARRNPVGFREALDVYREEMRFDVFYDLLDDADRDIINAEATGFMLGWAVGTVAWLLEQPPVGNPSIITLGDRPTSDLT